MYLYEYWSILRSDSKPQLLIIDDEQSVVHLDMAGIRLPAIYVFSLNSYYNLEETDTEKSRKLPKITQLVVKKPRFEHSSFWL